MHRICATVKLQFVCCPYGPIWQQEIVASGLLHNNKKTSHFLTLYGLILASRVFDAEIGVRPQ